MEAGEGRRVHRMASSGKAEYNISSTVQASPKQHRLGPPDKEHAFQAIDGVVPCKSERMVIAQRKVADHTRGELQRH